MVKHLILLTLSTLTTVLNATTTSSSLPDNYFPLWLDPPSKTTTPAPWYELIKTSAGQSFTSEGNDIEVNMGQGKGTIHLYANPAFMQSKDDALRKFSGALSRNMTGTVDRCGWPDKPASEAPLSSQWTRRSEVMHEDFSNGFDPKTMVVGLQKGCCAVDKYASNPFHKNINIVQDVVNGVTKSVLKLTAYNQDNVDLCPGPRCKKDVSSSGTIATADIFASGRYEVRAKVPKASGLVWAMWTFHYEEHLPNDCTQYSCWCKKMPRKYQFEDACEFRFDGSGKPCKYENVCDNNQDGWDPTAAPPAGCFKPSECASQHAGDPDPQFLGNDTFGGWTTMVNHEIDIEIPANCVNTSNVCNNDVPGVPGAKSCIGDFSTSNFNNYIYTQNSGSGPAYSNMCVKATLKDGKTPMELVGDGKYHTYRFDWHTGSGVESPGRVDFYFDNIYMGTNNAYVPTRGGRLYIAHWYPASKNNIWNGAANDWGGGTPGDGKVYSMDTFISSVTVTPFNEDNDMMAVNTADKPGEKGACNVPYNSKYQNCHPVWTPVTIPKAVDVV